MSFCGYLIGIVAELDLLLIKAEPVALFDHLLVNKTTFMGKYRGSYNRILNIDTEDGILSNVIDIRKTNFKNYPAKNKITIIKKLYEFVCNLQDSDLMLNAQIMFAYNTTLASCFTGESKDECCKRTKKSKIELRKDLIEIGDKLELSRNDYRIVTGAQHWEDD